MEKRKSRKYLIGAVALATELFLSSCGAANVQDNEQIELMTENGDFEVESVNDETLPLARIAEQVVESVDEFSEERKEFENLMPNYKQIYTEEFRSLEEINIDWNASRQCYEITGKKDEIKYEITLEDSDLINFLIHQTNCQELYLAHDKDSKLLSSLTECDTIKFIDIDDCNISSLDGLENLTNLEKLFIYNCANITDLSPIKNLTNLNEIGINGTKIADISILANLPKLTYLNLRCNEITNPEVLGTLENITHVDLEYNQITDFEQLRGLIEKGIITEEYASAIVSIPENQRLNYTTANYQEKATVLSITYLDSKEAYFVETRNDDQKILTFALTPDIFDFYGLTDDLPNCTYIRLINCPKESFSFCVADATKYDSMFIDHCDFDNLYLLDDFKNLTHLSINSCPNLVDPFEWPLFNIYKMDNLKTLIVKGTSINNFEPIKHIKSLEQIELKYNDITNFNFLMDLPNLQIVLVTADNYPVDPKPLETIQENGVIVWINGNLLPEPEEDKELEQEEEKGLGLTPEN